MTAPLHSSSPVATGTDIDFSIIIATRNRGPLLKRALRSVVNQTGVRHEVVVVDDGSSTEHATHVSRAVGDAGKLARLVVLPARPAGHGPSFARNSGVAVCRGTFIGFLDDDDEWTDDGHLARCLASAATTGSPVEVIFGDQRAVRPDGSEHTGRMWLRGLEQRLNGTVNSLGALEADIDALLAVGGICHLNTLIMRRSLFDAIGGFDERLRYEEDRDLFLRAIDAAGRMLYQPSQIGTHFIPDPDKALSLTSTISDRNKCLAQLLLYERAQLDSRHRACRTYARRSKGRVLKHLCLQLSQAGRHRDAHAYRLQALSADFSFKWLLYTLFCTARLPLDLAFHVRDL